MGIITKTERQKYFAYLDGVADGLNESRNDVNEVLDKIRAEIEQMDFDFGDFYDHTDAIIEMVLDIIDKYRGKSI